MLNKSYLPTHYTPTTLPFITMVCLKYGLYKWLHLGDSYSSEDIEIVVNVVAAQNL